MSDESKKQIDCPSAQPSTEGARIFGVMTGTPEAAPGRLSHRGLAGFRRAAGPFGTEAKPTQTLPHRGTLLERLCKHFKGNACSLAQRIVEGVPPVVNALPACQIRSTCRWFRQEGREACFRCPQVMTDKSNASDYEKQIADSD